MLLNDYLGYMPVFYWNFVDSKKTPPSAILTRSSAKRIIGKNGSVVTLPANTPSIAYDPGTGKCMGLSIRKAYTDLCLNKPDYNGASGIPYQHSTTYGAGYHSAQTIVGKGVEDGIPYLDFRITGTAGKAANGANKFMDLVLYTDQTPVVVGREASMTTYVKIQSTNNVNCFSSQKLGCGIWDDTASVYTSNIDPLESMSKRLSECVTRNYRKQGTTSRAARQIAISFGLAGTGAFDTIVRLGSWSYSYTNAWHSPPGASTTSQQTQAVDKFAIGAEHFKKQGTVIIEGTMYSGTDILNVTFGQATSVNRILLHMAYEVITVARDIAGVRVASTTILPELESFYSAEGVKYRLGFVFGGASGENYVSLNGKLIRFNETNPAQIHSIFFGSIDNAVQYDSDSDLHRVIHFEEKLSAEQLVKYTAL